MFSFLYPFSFLVALIALTIWFYHRDQDRRAGLLKKVFFGAMALYGISWLFADGDFGYKFPVLLREMILLAVLPWVLSFFRRVPWAWFALVAVVAIGLKQWYFEDLRQTFPQRSVATGSVQADPNGELLIELDESADPDVLQALIERFGLRMAPAFQMTTPDITLLDEYFVLDVPDATPEKLHEVRKALLATNVVEYIETNEVIAVVVPEAVPARRTGKRFGLNDPGVEQLWGFEAMDMERFFSELQKQKPQRKATVAILDTGVDAAHEDLAANYHSAKAAYDTDRMGHGTHCAGIAAAVANNGKGIAGFSPTNEHLQITSIKVLSDNGYGTQQSIINGILEAADAGADVLSLSLGGPSSDRKQRAYQKAVEYAGSKGAIVVVAAGNSGSNARNFAPANTPGVIAVSAVDTLLQKASFSNTVQDLDYGLAAPGTGIYSTYPGNQYRHMNGTSMATPYVSALVGVLKSLDPSLTTEDVYRLLNESGKTLSDGRKTGKLIQPARAIAFASQ